MTKVSSSRGVHLRSIRVLVSVLFLSSVALTLNSSQPIAEAKPQSEINCAITPAFTSAPRQLSHSCLNTDTNLQQISEQLRNSPLTINYGVMVLTNRAGYIFPKIHKLIAQIQVDGYFRWAHKYLKNFANSQTMPTEK